MRTGNSNGAIAIPANMQVQTCYRVNVFDSFVGSPDDPDPYQQPAPLKLCHQLIEDIKWFKVISLLRRRLSLAK